MLGKLINHEWKAVWKVLTLINSFTVLVTLIGCISLYSPLWKSDIDYVGLLAVSYMMLYYVGIIVVSFSSMIFLAVRFYKNIYTDEGYLMHTLPVKTKDLILSKGIVAFVWISITGLLIFLSVFLLGITLVKNIDSEVTLRYFYETFEEGIQLAFGMNVLPFVLWMIVYCIIATISSICGIYGAISLGQLFQKHKVLGSFLSYAGIYMILQTITSLIITPYTTRILISESYGSSSTIGDIVNPMMNLSLIPTVVMGIGLYILTLYIMKKKLNLD